MNWFDGLAILILGFVFFVWVLGMYMVITLLRAKVPLVPTPKKTVIRMGELAGMYKDLKVYDLGSGLGDILLGVAEIYPNNNFVGYELLRPAVWWSNCCARFSKKNVKFICADFFKQDLSDADIIFCYLWPSIMDRFYKEIFPTLKPSVRVVSHGFKIEGIDPYFFEQRGRTKIYIYRKAR